jgi:hypothetical protein
LPGIPGREWSRPRRAPSARRTRAAEEPHRSVGPNKGARLPALLAPPAATRRREAAAAHSSRTMPCQPAARGTRCAGHGGGPAPRGTRASRGLAARGRCQAGSSRRWAPAPAQSGQGHGPQPLHPPGRPPTAAVPRRPPPGPPRRHLTGASGPEADRSMSSLHPRRPAAPLGSGTRARAPSGGRPTRGADGGPFPASWNGRNDGLADGCLRPPTTFAPS